MKKRFFKFIEISPDVLQSFLDRHPEMKQFISSSSPFYVRIGCKLFPTLVHTILSESDQDTTQLLNNFIEVTRGKITAKNIAKIENDILIKTIGFDKANILKLISYDILNKKLNLKQLVKEREYYIYQKLSAYPMLTPTMSKTFAIFGCFKQNVLCNEQKEFINGLKIFLNKNEITQEDIDNISNKYKNELTLFSLCMFRINNERAGK